MPAVLFQNLELLTNAVVVAFMCYALTLTSSLRSFSSNELGRSTIIKRLPRAIILLHLHSSVTLKYLHSYNLIQFHARLMTKQGKGRVLASHLVSSVLPSKGKVELALTARFTISLSIHTDSRTAQYTV